MSTHPLKGEHLVEVCEPELLWALYWGFGYGAKRIGNMFCVSKRTVYRRMKEYSIPTRTMKESTKFLSPPRHDIDSDLLWSLYHGNLYSIRKIAKLFGHNCHTISNMLHEYNIPIRDGKELHIIKPFTYEIEPELLWGLYWGNQCSLKKIANIVGCSVGAIKHKMGLFGIPCRDASTRSKLAVHKPNCSCTRCRAERGEMRKENHTQWIKNREELRNKHQQLSETNEWCEWRKSVYERDNYMCQLCGMRGNMVYLNPHHIHKRDKYPDRIFDVDNGITLCKSCHNRVNFHEDDYIEMFEMYLQLPRTVIS